MQKTIWLIISFIVIWCVSLWVNFKLWFVITVCIWEGSFIGLLFLLDSVILEVGTHLAFIGLQLLLDICYLETLKIRFGNIVSLSCWERDWVLWSSHFKVVQSASQRPTNLDVVVPHFFLETKKMEWRLTILINGH